MLVLFQIYRSHPQVWLAKMAAQLLLALVLLGVTHRAHAQVEPSMVIGQSVPLTGVAASVGIPLVAGTQVAIDAANANGGVLGAKIRLVALDDNFVPERTHENVLQLIQQHKAIAILNVIGAPNSEGLVKKAILESAGVPLIGPFTASTAVRALKSPWVYFIAAGAREEAVAMVKQAKSMGVSRIGVMFQDDLFGRDGHNEVAKAAQALELSVVATGKFQRNAENIDQAIDDLGKASPQAIFMFAPGVTSAKFASLYRKKYGLRSLLISSSAGSVEAIVAAGGKDGAVGIGLVQVVPNPNSTTSLIAKEYRAAMAKYGPKDWKPSSYGLQGYIVGKAIVEALRRGGKPTSSGVIKGLDSMNRWDVGGYLIDFTDGNRLGSTYIDIGIIGNAGKLMN